MLPVPARTQLVPKPQATQGAGLNYKDPPIEPADHALGRSRGGISTKIHALTNVRMNIVDLVLTPGQAGDNPVFIPLLDQYRADHPGMRVHAAADKAYSHPSTRSRLRARRIPHTIPERDDQIARRKAKGSSGGRPPKFDAQKYRDRNVVERGFSRLKQWRGIATRFDKHARSFAGGVQLAATILTLRTI
ncbi:MULTISPECIES: IS5 family transposase [Brevibacterium]|uniref:IS5 family transposase n=1 Tax=Brevibacterium TaxID=1696 RepID=UPI0021F80985|nr:MULTISPECIES: IS5 family transposase [Brevibacterium]